MIYEYEYKLLNKDRSEKQSFLCSNHDVWNDIENRVDLLFIHI